MHEENGRQVIVLEAVPSKQFAPFVFESKPYKRVGSTTTVMSQEEYARLLLDRNHSRHRWEEFEKYRIMQDRLFESDFDRVVAETKRLSEGTEKETPRKGGKP